MEIIKPGRRFDFMGKRRYFIGASLVLLLLSILSLFWPGLRLGTDFKGGTEIEIALKAGVPVADVREAVHRAGFESPEVVSVQDKDNPNRVLIRVQEVSALSEAQKNAVRERLCLETEGVALPEDRCPPSARASEVRFSPGGEEEEDGEAGAHERRIATRRHPHHSPRPSPGTADPDDVPADAERVAGRPLDHGEVGAGVEGRAVWARSLTRAGAGGGSGERHDADGAARRRAEDPRRHWLRRVADEPAAGLAANRRAVERVPGARRGASRA